MATEDDRKNSETNITLVACDPKHPTGISSTVFEIPLNEPTRLVVYNAELRKWCIDLKGFLEKEPFKERSHYSLDGRDLICLRGRDTIFLFKDLNTLGNYVLYGMYSVPGRETGGYDVYAKADVTAIDLCDLLSVVKRLAECFRASDISSVGKGFVISDVLEHFASHVEQVSDLSTLPKDDSVVEPEPPYLAPAKLEEREDSVRRAKDKSYPTMVTPAEYDPTFYPYIYTDDQNISQIAAICVINPAGQILTAFHKTRQCWEIPQGRTLRTQELFLPHHAAVRELQEETGLVLDPEKLIHAATYKHQVRDLVFPWITHLYFYWLEKPVGVRDDNYTTQDDGTIVQKTEHLGWYAPSQLPQPRSLALRTSLLLLGH